MINGILAAEFLTKLALARLEVDAVLPVNHWHIGYSLRKGNPNRGIRGKRKFAVHQLPVMYVFNCDSASRAYLGASATADTCLGDLNEGSSYFRSKPRL